MEQYKMREVTAKVVILGDSGAGKTSYAQRYVAGKWLGNYRFTVGVDFVLKVIQWSEKVRINLQLWDIAGQERFSSMTRVYYKDAQAGVIMFDLSRRNTFLNAAKWKADLDEKCQQPDGSAVPCILLANKCDLSYREVSQEEIEQLCQRQNFIGWTELSVKEGLMVEESLSFVLEKFMDTVRYLEESDEYTPITDNGKISLTESQKSRELKKKKEKCQC